MNLQNINIGIIGCGKLGISLANAFSKLNLLLFCVENNPYKIKTIVENVSKNVIIYNNINEIEELPNILFLTVPDNQILNLSENIALIFQNKLKNITIVHCSGSFNTDILIPCEKYGAILAALHPFQTFYNLNQDNFKNIYWNLQTNGNNDLLIKLIKLIGGHVIDFSKNENFNKALYHCSASIASNYLVTIIGFSSRIADLAGINSNQFIPPILKTTVENSIKSLEDLNIPLTGPLARGDLSTIENHLQELEPYKTELKIFYHLTMAAAEFAYQNNILDNDSFFNLKTLFLKYLKKEE